MLEMRKQTNRLEEAVLLGLAFLAGATFTALVVFFYTILK